MKVNQKLQNWNRHTKSGVRMNKMSVLHDFVKNTPSLKYRFMSVCLWFWWLAVGWFCSYFCRFLYVDMFILCNFCNESVYEISVEVGRFYL